MASNFFYHGILQRNYRKMTINGKWSFSYYSSVKFYMAKVWEQQHDCYIQIHVIISCVLKGLHYCVHYCILEFHLTEFTVIALTVLQYHLEICTYNMGLDPRKPVSGVCEQQRRRPACTFAQSDQLLSCSLIGKYHIKTCYKRNFNILASHCG